MGEEMKRREGESLGQWLERILVDRLLGCTEETVASEYQKVAGEIFAAGRVEGLIEGQEMAKRDPYP